MVDFSHVLGNLLDPVEVNHPLVLSWLSRLLHVPLSEASGAGWSSEVHSRRSDSNEL